MKINNRRFFLPVVLCLFLPLLLASQKLNGESQLVVDYFEKYSKVKFSFQSLSDGISLENAFLQIENLGDHSIEVNEDMIKRLLVFLVSIDYYTTGGEVKRTGVAMGYPVSWTDVNDYSGEMISSAERRRIDLDFEQVLTVARNRFFKRLPADFLRIERIRLRGTLKNPFPELISERDVDISFPIKPIGFGPELLQRFIDGEILKREI